MRAPTRRSLDWARGRRLIAQWLWLPCAACGTPESREEAVEVRIDTASTRTTTRLPFAGEPISAEDFTIAGFPLDPDTAWVLQALGRPRSVRKIDHPFSPGTEYTEWAYSGVDVLISPAGVIVSMNVRRPGLLTRRAVGVGSSLADVLAAYGPADSGNGPDEHWEYLDPAQELHFLSFTLANGRVSRISFGYFLD